MGEKKQKIKVPVVELALVKLFDENLRIRGALLGDTGIRNIHKGSDTLEERSGCFFGE